MFVYIVLVSGFGLHNKTRLSYSMNHSQETLKDTERDNVMKKVCSLAMSIMIAFVLFSNIAIADTIYGVWTVTLS